MSTLILCWWEYKVFSRSWAISFKQHLTPWSKFLSKKKCKHAHRILLQNCSWQALFTIAPQTGNNKNAQGQKNEYCGVFTQWIIRKQQWSSLSSTTWKNLRHYAEQWQPQKSTYLMTPLKRNSIRGKNNLRRKIKIEVALGKRNDLYATEYGFICQNL